MRIVQVVESLDLGGLERLALSLAIEQKRHGDDPHIYCVFRRGTLAAEAEAAGIPVVSFDKKPGPAPHVLWQIVRRLLTDRPDVVHTHNPGIHHYGALAAALARVPVTANTWHSVLSSHGVPYRTGHFRWACRFTDAIAFVSEQVRRAVLPGLGNYHRPTPVVPCAIPIARYRERPAHPGSALPRVRFGALGRMVPAKAYEVLLDAFVAVVAAIPSATLRIAGGGPLYDQLGSQAVRLGISPRVSIQEATDDPGAFFADLDVFVMSSRSEGLPLVLLEALAAGVPAVATRVGGIPEVLPENIGWLCPAQDRRALAEAMIMAARASDLPARVSRGVTLVAQHYSVEAMCQQYHDLFAEILAAKGAKRRKFPLTADQSG
jgi:glycosyltransferase involved in cell wall biosynthesis